MHTLITICHPECACIIKKAHYIIRTENVFKELSSPYKNHSAAEVYQVHSCMNA